MPTNIIITAGKISLKAELFDTPTARAVAEKLPIEARPSVWGDEFYFAIDVTAALDKTATTAVKVGDLGYWPPGEALAIFFGPTPMSTGADPVPASAVNLIGQTLDDARLFREARNAKMIRIEAA